MSKLILKFFIYLLSIFYLSNTTDIDLECTEPDKTTTLNLNSKNLRELDQSIFKSQSFI